jgi:hypothetical protein
LAPGGTARLTRAHLRGAGGLAEGYRVEHVAMLRVSSVCPWLSVLDWNLS